MENELLTRWRLILGKGDDGSCDGTGCQLSETEQIIDKALESVYDSTQGSDLKKSASLLKRWLGDIRHFFPENVVHIIQRDAVEKLDLKSLLAEKEFLENAVPDVNLVATLMTLGKAIPDNCKHAVGQIVKKLVDELYSQLYFKMQQALTGSINRVELRRNTSFRDINWHATILKNLKNYQPKYKTIIPEVRIGYGKKRRSFYNIIMCIDQSDSMAESMIYSAVYGAIMASLPSLKTRLVVFDTEPVDLTEKLPDAVELLCGVQLGGGTDIANALKYCSSVVEQPKRTVLVLISDLYEYGSPEHFFRRVAKLLDSGVKIIVLLALSKSGTGMYNRHIANYLASLNIPVFACSPDRFPEIMAQTLNDMNIG